MIFKKNKNSCLLFLLLMLSHKGWAGLDDLDDLDDLDPEVPVEQKKSPEKKNDLQYDKEIQSGKKESKPIPSQPSKATQESVVPKEAAPPLTPSPGGHPPQSKIKTAPEKKKDADKQPVKIKSKGLRALKNKGILELKEEVVITQGDLILTADYAKVYSNKQDESQVEKIYVKGNVKINKNAELKEDRVVARGDEATFYNKTRKVTLVGNAQLLRGSDLIKGRRIDYDMNTGWITVDRAEGVIDPEKSMER